MHMATVTTKYRLVPRLDAVAVEQQAEEDEEDRRVDEVHHLERGDDPQACRMWQPRQQRQQRPGLRRGGSVREPTRHHVSVLTTVPSKTVVGLNTSRAKVDNGEDGQPDRHNDEIRLPGSGQVVESGALAP